MTMERNFAQLQRMKTRTSYEALALELHKFLAWDELAAKFDVDIRRSKDGAALNEDEIIALIASAIWAKTIQAYLHGTLKDPFPVNPKRR